MDIIKQINEFLPTYSVNLPFSKKEISFTPFKVKDLKNITVVLQENNKKLAFLAMVEILKNNSKITEKELLSLSLADAEYLFLQIRSKSVEENLNLIYNNENIKINILDVKHKNSVQSKTFDVSENIKITLETPTVKSLLGLESFDKENLIKASISKIVIKNEIYDTNKFVPEEIKEILNNLPIKFVSNFDTFSKTDPELYVELKTETGT